MSRALLFALVGFLVAVASFYRLNADYDTSAGWYGVGAFLGGAIVGTGLVVADVIRMGRARR